MEWETNYEQITVTVIPCPGHPRALRRPRGKHQWRWYPGQVPTATDCPPPIDGPSLTTTPPRAPSIDPPKLLRNPLQTPSGPSPETLPDPAFGGGSGRVSEEGPEGVWRGFRRSLGAIEGVDRGGGGFTTVYYVLLCFYYIVLQFSHFSYFHKYCFTYFVISECFVFMVWEVFERLWRLEKAREG